MSGMRHHFSGDPWGPCSQCQHPMYHEIHRPTLEHLSGEEDGKKVPLHDGAFVPSAPALFGESPRGSSSAERCSTVAICACGHPHEDYCGDGDICGVAEPRSEHELKCWPGYYPDVELGRKPFEVRRDDRVPPFREGDTLLLREWGEDRGYTGQECRRLITYVLSGDQFGIAPGYCVLGLAVA